MTPAREPEFARADALAGLAREVEGLRRTVAPLDGTADRLDDLARVVAQLADALASITARTPTTAPPSWLLAPADDGLLLQLLGELRAWLRAVYLRYPDGAASLPECWLWHPDVVEELLWLQHAWCAAYQGKNAGVALVGDWHDRQRPGVVRRIRQAAGACSREAHLTRPDWDQVPAGAVGVPGVAAVPHIAAWWADRREDPGPELPDLPDEPRRTRPR